VYGLGQHQRNERQSAQSLLAAFLVLLVALASFLTMSGPNTSVPMLFAFATSIVIAFALLMLSASVLSVASAPLRKGYRFSNPVSAILFLLYPTKKSLLAKRAAMASIAATILKKIVLASAGLISPARRKLTNAANFGLRSSRLRSRTNFERAVRLLMGSAALERKAAAVLSHTKMLNGYGATKKASAFSAYCLSSVANSMSIITSRLLAADRMIGKIFGCFTRNATCKNLGAIQSTMPWRTACFFGDLSLEGELR
jgi:hypothetical protein